jgi:S1-C subfamily serine protease
VFQKISFTTKDMGTMAGYVDVHKMRHEEAARQWLSQNRHKWEYWTGRTNVAYDADEQQRIDRGTTKIVKKKQPKKKEKKKEPKQSPDDNKVVAASMGSGFFVTRAGHIVTNHHVIDQCKAVKVNYKGDEIPAKILASDKTNDLAIIQAKITPNKVYPVSNEDASLLQDVIVAGFPLGKKVSAVIKTHKGSITALAGFGDNFSNFQTDATINQGNSGGPIINLKGNVVGVAVQLIAAEHAQNIFFGVKSSTLKTFANAKGINFLPPNHREMSNENLSKLITEATVYLECWMTVAKIKQIIAQEENRKAFYSEHK